MSSELLSFGRQNLRGTDTNSLLRLYDLATGVFKQSVSQLERARAEKAIQRLAHELQKRNVSV
jgi:hypothetical protein